MKKLTLFVGMFFTALSAQAIHYGCVTSPSSPKTAFLYENEELPLHYVEKIQNADGSNMLGNVPNVVYPHRKLVQTGYGSALIDQTSKTSIIVVDKLNATVLNILYIDPDDVGGQDQQITLQTEVIFDGQPTKTLIYSFCGERLVFYQGVQCC